MEQEDNFSDYPDIRKFSYTDSVFELLSNESDDVFAWPCGNGNPHAIEDTDRDYDDDYCTHESDDIGALEYKLRLRYDRLGLKRNLFFTFKHRDSKSWSSNHVETTAYSLNYIGEYTPRCENTTTFDHAFPDDCDSNSYEKTLRYTTRDMRKTIYSNSRALAYYELGAQVQFFSGCNYDVDKESYIGGNTNYTDPSLGYCVRSLFVITTEYKEIKG